MLLLPWHMLALDQHPAPEYYVLYYIRVCAAGGMRANPTSTTQNEPSH